MLAGCSASGPLFKEISVSEKNNGLIFLYRPYKLAAILQSPEVFIDEKHLCDLHNDSYCKIELGSGKHNLSINTWVSTLNRGTVIVDVQPAKTIFISYDIEEELKWGTGLSILGSINAMSSGHTNLLSWLENEDKLIVHIKDSKEGLAEIRKTKCANC
jgi:hypothetical protein